jgi:hypothetical protein
MPTRLKTPSEVRSYPWDFDELIATGAIISTVEAFVSRLPSLTAPLIGTELDNPVTAGASTIDLKADPKAGALLILEPGSAVEERLKVMSVTGAVAPFVCTVRPLAWFNHADNSAVSYERGCNARMLIDDTPNPSGVMVTPQLRRGTDGQKYRVTGLATANNGEVREDEFELQVVDPIPGADDTRIKQPSEQVFVAAGFEKLLSEPHQAGATLNPGTTFASLTTTTSTTLSSVAAAEAGTILLVADPGVGAMLLIEPSGFAERVYVSAVSGSGPFTATITPPLEEQHGAGTQVTIFGGVTGTLLASGTSTIQGLFALNTARRGAANKTFKLVWLVSTSQGETLQHSGLLSTTEL